MSRIIKKIFKLKKDHGFKGMILVLTSFIFDSRKKAIKKEIANWNFNNQKIKHADGGNKNGLVSVVIPIYDRTVELKNSIDSILNQTYTNFELILVTDGSPKKTFDIVEGYRKNPKVRIFHYFDNTGNAVRGRNKGIKEAEGEFIAFQDSDDIADPERLKKSVEYAKKTKAGIVYGGWRAMVSCDRQDVEIENNAEFLPKKFNNKQLLRDNYICQSAVLAKRSAILDVGGLKRNMEYREDHELWLRLLFFGYKFEAMPEIVTNLRLHAGNNELKFKGEDHKWYELMLQEYRKKAILPKKIAYVIPGVGISGGIAVVLQHVNRLLKNGFDVMVLSQDLEEKIDWFPGQSVPIYAWDCDYCKKNIDIAVATSWSTVPSADTLSAKRKIYFVQSDERRFYDDLEKKKFIEKTYSVDFEYMTEAKWIQKWLKEEFGHETYYVPNGLDEKIFFKTEPIEPKTSKPRVLIEGAINVPFKGMDDAYAAVKDLDCELWIVSNNGKPKKDWRYDRFFENVPFDKMNEIYSSCDIFLKMSRVEGFFGPPMEAMACGCAVVVGKVTGYDEYIVDGENALVVEQGDVEEARKAVQRLIDNPDLRNKLIENGYKTAKQWDWDRSIDMLEKVIAGEKIDQYYDANSLVKYDFQKEVANLKKAKAEYEAIYQKED